MSFCGQVPTSILHLMGLLKKMVEISHYSSGDLCTLSAPIYHKVPGLHQWLPPSHQVINDHVQLFYVQSI